MMCEIIGISLSKIFSVRTSATVFLSVLYSISEAWGGGGTLTVSYSTVATLPRPPSSPSHDPRNTGPGEKVKRSECQNDKTTKKGPDRRLLLACLLLYYTKRHKNACCESCLLRMGYTTDDVLHELWKHHTLLWPFYTPANNALSTPYLQTLHSVDQA